MNKETEDFYIRLKSELEESTTWPAVYLYNFNNMGAVIKTHASKTGKYTSISINVTMQNADKVIEKYQELATIEGIISL
jgi:putative lipoic acid-binding regulatory protein